NIKKLMLLSMFTGIILTVTGLWLSYVFDLASGATIVLVLGAAFLLTSFVKHLLPAWLQAPASVE
ncbi:MAG: metal ABC transporter permease, partial [Euryarchaeota archaeon]|nr:metal ABC transporter permease [Euryarchaeota archaeon]